MLLSGREGVCRDISQSMSVWHYNVLAEAGYERLIPLFMSKKYQQHLNENNIILEWGNIREKYHLKMPRATFLVIVLSITKISVGIFASHLELQAKEGLDITVQNRPRSLIGWQHWLTIFRFYFFIGRLYDSLAIINFLNSLKLILKIVNPKSSRFKVINIYFTEHTLVVAFKGK